MNPDVSQITPSEPVRATDDGSNSSGGPSVNVNSVDRQAFGLSASSFSQEASQTQVRINHENSEYTVIYWITNVLMESHKWYNSLQNKSIMQC